jgi:WD40 domain-containing protein
MTPTRITVSFLLLTICVVAIATIFSTPRAANAIAAPQHTGRQSNYDGKVASIAFSPDGTLIAAIGPDEGAKVWDVSSGELRTEINNNGNCIAFSPNGKVIATCPGLGATRPKLWDALSGKQLNELEEPTDIPISSGNLVSTVAFSPDGTTVVGYVEGKIKNWNVANGRLRSSTGTELRSTKTDPEIHSVAFSPDGMMIARCKGREVKLFDAGSGRQLRVLSGHEGDVNSVVFSQDGKIIASGSDDHTIRLWDSTTGRQIRILGGPVLLAEDLIPATNWQQHPKINAIRKLVNSTNADVRNGSLKTEHRECTEDWFGILRIARDSKGVVRWYQHYHEGEDSSWDDNYYYDEAGRLRFALMTSYAINRTREQHRAYFDEGGRLIYHNRRLLKGPGYFGPQIDDLKKLVQMDPIKDFAEAAQGCKEIKSQRRHRAR